MDNKKDFLARVKASREKQEEKFDSMTDMLLLILLAFWAWFGAWMFF